MGDSALKTNLDGWGSEKSIRLLHKQETLIRKNIELRHHQIELKERFNTLIAELKTIQKGGVLSDKKMQDIDNMLEVFEKKMFPIKCVQFESLEYVTDANPKPVGLAMKIK